MNAILRASIILVIASLIAVVAARINPGMVEHHEMYLHLQHENLQHELGPNPADDLLGQAPTSDQHMPEAPHDASHDGASPDEGSAAHNMDNDHDVPETHDPETHDPDTHVSDANDPLQHGTQAHRMSVSNEQDFLAGMIPHHQEAVDSAEVMLEHSDRPELRAFAQAIIEAQQREIEQMTGWLNAWYPEDDLSVDYQPMMRPLEPPGNDAVSTDDVSTDDVERIFLEDMIVHHQMAVDMVEQLLDNDLVVHEEVAELAAAIRREQDQEISLMQTWLDDWF